MALSKPIKRLRSLRNPAKPIFLPVPERYKDKLDKIYAVASMDLMEYTNQTMKALGLAVNLFRYSYYAKCPNRHNQNDPVATKEIAKPFLPSMRPFLQFGVSDRAAKHESHDIFNTSRMKEI